MNGMPSTTVIQITNLSSSVNSEQMRTLFGFLGDIEELRLYPPDHTPLSFSSKVCYIKYKEPSSVGVAQHLTNTVFIDRALIVVPCAEGKIPEEAKALSLLAPAAPVPSLMPGGGLLPIPSPAPLQNLGLPLAARGPLHLGLDSSLSAISSQPPIMGNVDPSKIDEIRRTVYVGNLNSQTTTAEQLLEFFKQVGEVKFVRMAGDETQPTRFAFVEFANQDCVARALAFNGVMFGDRPLKINHSNNAIVKPPELTPQAAAKELEDVMKRVREAQSTIAAAIDPAEGKKRSSSRSRRSRRSHSKSRSHSRSRSQRKHSRSRHTGRPSQRSWRRTSDSHKRRSRDRKYSRSHSRERRKDRDGKMRRGDDADDRRRDKKGRTPLKGYRRSSRSPSNSRGHRKRSKSRSRSVRKKARSPSPRREKKDRRREHGRESSREWRARSTSRRRSRDSDRQASKAKFKQTESGYKQKEQDYESDGEDMGSGASEDFSPHAHHNGEYSSMHADEGEEFSTAE
ncbi:splicing regulatory glutamine/lysine-rich protein 1 isoform X2 [Pangasianodon hypophthalmus]|uniref:splicing regulatory glutamine/lysine-rich protein 1 isoform X2 n=1 Tax=Pangasianodon hypophthalmus TaxID=310915 RepID=UPI0023071DE2|nr:splicing regulatory glutamine/lysine-rich protein 1 isoform X2 [Pangasianodon hypophthalmus]